VRRLRGECLVSSEWLSSSYQSRSQVDLANSRRTVLRPPRQPEGGPASPSARSRRSRWIGPGRRCPDPLTLSHMGRTTSPPGRRSHGRRELLCPGHRGGGRIRCQRRSIGLPWTQADPDLTDRHDRYRHFGRGSVGLEPWHLTLTGAVSAPPGQLKCRRATGAPAAAAPAAGWPASGPTGPALSRSWPAAGHRGP
jgi:hypothetical protein